MAQANSLAIGTSTKIALMKKIEKLEFLRLELEVDLAKINLQLLQAKTHKKEWEQQQEKLTSTLHSCTIALDAARREFISTPPHAWHDKRPAQKTLLPTSEKVTFSQHPHTDVVNAKKNNSTQLMLVAIMVLTTLLITGVIFAVVSPPPTRVVSTHRLRHFAI